MHNPDISVYFQKDNGTRCWIVFVEDPQGKWVAEVYLPDYFLRTIPALKLNAYTLGGMALGVLITGVSPAPNIPIIRRVYATV